MAKCILLVDLDSWQRNCLAVDLESYQYHVLQAATAAEALEKTSIYFVEAVILQSGEAQEFALLSALRQRHPTLPVLILSPDHSVDATLHAIRLGACGYLTMPVSPATVALCLQEVLRQAPPAARPAKRLQRGRPSRHMRRDFYEIEFEEEG